MRADMVINRLLCLQQPLNLQFRRLNHASFLKKIFSVQLKITLSALTLPKKLAMTVSKLWVRKVI
ncbi:hypothetical protein D9M71_660890 [compost metagenome]